MTAPEYINKPCPRCDGQQFLEVPKTYGGDISDTELAPCPQCEGTGRVMERVETTAHGWKCMKCGTPNNELEPCPNCGSDLMVASS